MLFLVRYYQVISSRIGILDSNAIAYLTYEWKTRVPEAEEYVVLLGTIYRVTKVENYIFYWAVTVE